MDFQTCLSIIKEKYAGLVEANESFMDLLETQGWFNSVVCLHGPVLTNLVKTLWISASISNDNSRITAKINRIPFSISEESIAETIGYSPRPDDVGLNVFDRWNLNFFRSRNIARIYNNADHLKPFQRSMFRFFLSNLVPRANFHHLLLNGDRLLLHHLKNGRSNLPSIIFCHLKESLITLRCYQSFHIPYGRILSALLESTGVVLIIRNAESSNENDILVEEECEAFFA